MTTSATQKGSPLGVLAAVIGAHVGLIIAWIVSMNYVIDVVGHPDGYEASPIEVYRYSPTHGLINIAILVAGLALGACAGWLISGTKAR